MAPSQDIKGTDSTHPWGHGWCCLALAPTGRNSYIHLQFIQTAVFENNRNKQECHTNWIYPDTIYHKS